MEEWKFLLQKDGDRSWLPLDSPDVEILEGRYRIVAQTSHHNTDVNIRICHLATEEDPPKRRIQKRSNRANSNGLMVVIPFTHLQAGLWEFSCFLADPMSDLVGDTLTHAVRLQVAACVAEEEEWEEPQEPSVSERVAVELRCEPSPQNEACEEAEENTPQEEITQEVVPAPEELAALNLEIAQALGLSMDRLVEMTDQLSHQLVEEIFKEFNFVPQVIVPKASVAEEPMLPEVSEDREISAASEVLVLEEVVTEAVQPVSIAALQIALAQDVWMARRRESFTVSGHIEVEAQLSSESLGSPYPSSIIVGESSDSDVNSVADLSFVDLEGAAPTEIHLRLRDPQTSNVVFTACQAYPTGELPQPFSFLCQLPEDLTTHLLLGEMLLCGTLPGAEKALITFKSFNFTITVDPEGLVEELQRVKTAIEKEASLEDLPDFVAEFSAKLLEEGAKQRLDLSFLNLAAAVSEQSELDDKPVVKASSRMFPKAAKQILPPQIYQPDEVQAGKRKVELPAFATVGTQAANVAIAELEVEDEEDVEFAFAASALELESMLVAEPIYHEESLSTSFDGTGYGSSSADSVPQSPGDSSNSSEAHQPSDDRNDPSAVWSGEAAAVVHPTLKDEQQQEPQEPQTNPDRLEKDKATLDEFASPIQVAFQALNLQERFLNRLSSLAADTELITLLKPEMPAEEEPAEERSGEELSDADNVAIAVLEPDAELQSEPELPEIALITATLPETVAEEVTEEVVVDDPTWREWIKRSTLRSKKAEPDKQPEPETHQSIRTAIALPLEKPVPMPTVELITNKAIAGRPIGVRVKLPNSPSKVYVKLWINDRQTRSLLDGPRWLVDFLPNGFDELEANTQITAPFGSVEVRLEAIAVEMHSQRESQKVSIDCEVLPPDVADDELLAAFDLL